MSEQQFDKRRRRFLFRIFKPKNMRNISKPLPNEYPDYSKIYMDLVNVDGDILKFMKQNLSKIKAFIYSLPKEKLTYRYAPNKWTIKEILVHLIDDERIYTYRALRWARNDQTELPGFEQDDYVPFSNANERSLESIFSEYESVRNSTISLFENLPEKALMRRGITEGHSRTVRAMIYHLAGHELNHMKVIRERYI